MGGFLTSASKESEPEVSPFPAISSPRIDKSKAEVNRVAEKVTSEAVSILKGDSQEKKSTKQVSFDITQSAKVSLRKQNTKFEVSDLEDTDLDVFDEPTTMNDNSSLDIDKCNEVNLTSALEQENSTLKVCESEETLDLESLGNVESIFDEGEVERAQKEIPRTTHLPSLNLKRHTSNLSNQNGLIFER